MNRLGIAGICRLPLDSETKLALDSGFRNSNTNGRKHVFIDVHWFDIYFFFLSGAFKDLHKI